MHDLLAMAKMENYIRLADGVGRRHGGKKLVGEATKEAIAPNADKYKACSR